MGTWSHISLHVIWPFFFKVLSYQCLPNSYRLISPPQSQGLWVQVTVLSHTMWTSANYLISLSFNFFLCERKRIGTNTQGSCCETPVRKFLWSTLHHACHTIIHTGGHLTHSSSSSSLPPHRHLAKNVRLISLKTSILGHVGKLDTRNE